MSRNGHFPFSFFLFFYINVFREGFADVGAFSSLCRNWHQLSGCAGDTLGNWTLFKCSTLAWVCVGVVSGVGDCSNKVNPVPFQVIFEGKQKT